MKDEKLILYVRTFI